jgi:hypothetical protein
VPACVTINSARVARITAGSAMPPNCGTTGHGVKSLIAASRPRWTKLDKHSANAPDRIPTGQQQPGGRQSTPALHNVCLTRALVAELTEQSARLALE